MQQQLCAVQLTSVHTKDRPANGRSHCERAERSAVSLLAAFLPPAARETCTAKTKQQQRGGFGNGNRLQLNVGDSALTVRSGEKGNRTVRGHG